MAGILVNRFPPTVNNAFFLAPPEYFNPAVPPPSGSGSNFFSLPAERLTVWQPGVTYNGGIPNRTSVYLPSGGTYTLTASGDVSDRTSAIQTAINNCPSGSVVYLGPGDYRLNSTLFAKSHVTLRGAPFASGVPTTKIWRSYTGSYNPGNMIATNGLGNPLGSSSLTQDAISGSYSVTVASATGFSAGQMVMISQITDDAEWSWGGWSVRDVVFTRDGVGRGWFTRQDRPTGQTMMISQVNGNTLTFTTPLRLTYRTSLAADVERYTNGSTYDTMFGIEDMVVEGDPHYGPGNVTAGGMIMLNGTYKSWVKNVEVHYTLDGAIRFNASLMCEARHCFTHEAVNNFPGGSAYQIQFDYYSSDCLLEDSILYRSNKLVVARGGGSGCVVAYNYGDDSYDGSNFDWFDFGMIATHLCGGHHVLFEGNQAPNGDGDEIWGNANYITFFRNHFAGQRGCGATSSVGFAVGPLRCLGAQWGNKYYSAVGNVLGLSGTNYSGWNYETNDAPWGNGIYWLGGSPEFSDLDGHPVFNPSGTQSGWDIGPEPRTVATYLRHGNFDYKTNLQFWQTGSNVSLPDSLYLQSKPSFFGANTWPWVDPGGATKLHTLPARARFSSNVFF